MLFNKALFVLHVLSLLLIILSCSDSTSSSIEKGPELKYGTVTDIDQNLYKTVKIGDQWWMAENLKVTHFQDGEPIQNVKENIEWATLSTSAYCSYQNKDSIDNNGLLYNWYAINSTANIAPKGWHVASDDEWKELEIYLGMSESEYNYIGFRGKDIGSQLKDGDFSALSGGFRKIDGDFSSAGSHGYWWTASEFCRLNAWYHGLTNVSDMVYRNFDSKIYGYSVRCVKD